MVSPFPVGGKDFTKYLAQIRNIKTGFEKEIKSRAASAYEFVHSAYKPDLVFSQFEKAFRFSNLTGRTAPDLICSP